MNTSGRAGRRRRLAVALVSIAVLGTASCSSGERRSVGRGGDDGVTKLSGSEVAARLDTFPLGAPTREEIAGLERMREEELLARDVYVALGERWGTKVFTNISSAEQTHTDAVKALLDRHAAVDPAADHTPGTFADPELQSLYTSLVDQGNGSLVAALTVGATVEDLDLADLAARATTTPDIAWVYANLSRGSRNHLRAFVEQLDRNGVDYTPSHITENEFESIISGEMERGPGA